MTRPSGDGGSLAPAVPIFAFVLLLLGGLVIDASRVLNARGRAVAYAEEAARAGASAVQPGAAVLALDEPVVKARVADYCAALRADPEQHGGLQTCEFVTLETVSGTDPRRVVVRTRVALQIPTTLLGIIGVRRLDASGEARARPFEGVNPGDVDSTAPPPTLLPDPIGTLEPPPPIVLAPPPLPRPTPTVSLPPTGVPTPAPTVAPSVPPSPSALP